jgi:hypothetical protein
VLGSIAGSLSPFAEIETIQWKDKPPGYGSMLDEPANGERGAKPGEHEGGGVRKPNDDQACGTGRDRPGNVGGGSRKYSARSVKPNADAPSTPYFLTSVV